jgi:hypothetical protein
MTRAMIVWRRQELERKNAGAENRLIMKYGETQEKEERTKTADKRMKSQPFETW